MAMGNVMIGQSGGPTAVINSSLAGIFSAAKERGADKVYGMRYGIQGLLEGRYVNLYDHLHDKLDIELLKRTPSAYLGTCRFMMPAISQPGKESENKAMFDKVFALLNELKIKYFFYIGGNDSMDTIKKLSDYASIIGSDITFFGVPKTIDNDLMETDHTPGYPSAAKCIGTLMKEIICDASSFNNKNVTIVEIMGRNAGWLTAASALACMDDCPGPDMIYVPEVVFDMDLFMERVTELQQRKSSIVLAVSEGLKVADGRYVCELEESMLYQDSFGHKSLSGTAHYLADQVAETLGSKTRYIELSTLQRSASHLVSGTDVAEAFLAGGHAVAAAVRGENAKMIIFRRVSDDPYQIVTEPFDINKIANREKKLPLDWLNEDKTYVNEKFLTYCRPLIQDELSPIIVDGLPRHLYHKLG